MFKLGVVIEFALFVRKQPLGFLFSKEKSSPLFRGGRSLVVS